MVNLEQFKKSEESADQTPFGADHNLPRRNWAAGQEIKLATGLVLQVGEDTHLLNWDHMSPTGQRSNVQFIVRPNSEMSLDIQIESMEALFRRDHVRERASNPLISAFFKGLLSRPDVSLARIANCSASRVMFISRSNGASLKLENVELHSCAITLEAGALELNRVAIDGNSTVTIAAQSSQLRSFKIGRDCYLSGDLGQATISADCVIECYAKYLNMLKTKWLEDPSGPNVRQRTRGIVVGKMYRTDEFAKQAGLTSMQAELEADRKKSIEDDLDQNWK